MDNQEIDTLEKLVEIVGKRMQHYHVFRRELAALREAAQQSVHADGACPKCGAEGYVILGDGRKYCNVCKTPRR